MPLDKPSWKTPLVAMKLAAILLIGILLLGIYIKTENPSIDLGPISRRSSTRIQPYTDRTVDLKSFNLPESPYLLIGFWASWCPTCKPEIKDLDRLYKEWTSGPSALIQPNQLKIVSINVDPPQNQQKVDKLWKDLNVDLPRLLLPEENILDALEIQVLPSYVLIKDNQIYLLKMDGATNWSSENIQNSILNEIKK